MLGVNQHAGLGCVPSVRDGVFRVYSGQRSLKDLKDYIERQDWKQTEPVSWLYAPDSIL